MERTDLVWGGILLAAAGLQARELRRGGRGAFCNLVRRVFATESTAGRVAFLAVWAGFAGWYASHVIGGSPQGVPNKTNCSR